MLWMYPRNVKAVQVCMSPPASFKHRLTLPVRRAINGRWPLQAASQVKTTLRGGLPILNAAKAPGCKNSNASDSPKINETMILLLTWRTELGRKGRYGKSTAIQVGSIANMELLLENWTDVNADDDEELFSFLQRGLSAATPSSRPVCLRRVG